jgi:hypothetical protein
MPEVTGIQAELERLNNKYPTCSTCQFRAKRTVPGAKKSKALALQDWCERHGRLIEYEWSVYTDDRGKVQKMVIGDVPCDDYVYLYVRSLFS